MPKGFEPLPFDEKNEEDFIRITDNIRTALDKIRHDKSVAATQERLSKLAGCSRKTLYLRQWPLTELKKIKSDRKALTSNRPKKVTAAHRLSVEAHIDRENRLISRVRNLEEQNGSLFDKMQVLERDLTDQKELVRILEEEKTSYKEENRKLENEIYMLKQSPNGGANVVSINTPEYIKKAKKGNK